MDQPTWETFTGWFLDGPWKRTERTLTMQVGSDRNIGMGDEGAYRPEGVDPLGRVEYRWHPGPSKPKTERR